MKIAKFKSPNSNRQIQIKEFILILVISALPHLLLGSTLSIENDPPTGVTYQFTPGSPGFYDPPIFLPPVPASFVYDVQPYYPLSFPSSIDLDGVDTLQVTWTAPAGQAFTVTPPANPDFSNAGLNFGAVYDGSTSGLAIESSTYSFEGLSGTPGTATLNNNISPSYFIVNERFNITSPLSFSSFTETITFSSPASGTFTLDNDSFLTFSGSTSNYSDTNPYQTGTPGLVMAPVPEPGAAPLLAMGAILLILSKAKFFGRKQCSN